MITYACAILLGRHLCMFLTKSGAYFVRQPNDMALLTPFLNLRKWLRFRPALPDMYSKNANELPKGGKRPHLPSGSTRPDVPATSPAKLFLSALGGRTL